MAERSGGARAVPAILALVAGALVGPAPALGQAPGIEGRGTLSGRILEAGTDRPVPSAWIFIPLIGHRVQADAGGRFSLRGLPLGETLVLRVDQLGYRTRNRPVLLGDAVTSVVIRLEPDPVELEGLEVSGERSYSATRLLERRVARYRFGSTISGQLALLSSDAPSMVDYIWEEADALFLPCLGEDQWSWEWSCMRFRGRRVPVEVCVDDVAAPGGPAMLYQYAPEDLFRVEVLPDMGQVRLYTRPYIAHLNRTGKVPPIWPRWLGGCMGGDVAWSPPTKGEEGG